MFRCGIGLCYVEVFAVMCMYIYARSCLYLGFYISLRCRFCPRRKKYKNETSTRDFLFVCVYETKLRLLHVKRRQIKLHNIFVPFSPNIRVFIVLSDTLVDK